MKRQKKAVEVASNFEQQPADDALIRQLERRLIEGNREELSASPHSQHAFYRPLLHDSWKQSLNPVFGNDVLSDILEHCPLREKAQTVTENKGKNRVLRLSNIRDKLNRTAIKPSSSPECTEEDRFAGIASQKNNKQSRRFISISNKEAKLRQLYDIDTGNLDYKDYQPLAELWLQYIRDILPKTMPVKQQQLCLMKADLHGAFICVERSKCPSYVGLKGIMLQETQETFRIIGEDNRLRTILKGHSVFSIVVNDNKYYIHGQFLTHRPSERSKAKPKPKTTLLLP